MNHFAGMELNAGFLAIDSLDAARSMQLCWMPLPSSFGGQSLELLVKIYAVDQLPRLIDINILTCSRYACSLRPATLPPLGHQLSWSASSPRLEKVP